MCTTLLYGPAINKSEAPGAKSRIDIECIDYCIEISGESAAIDLGAAHGATELVRALLSS